MLNLKFLMVIFIFWRLGLFFAAWVGGKIFSFLPQFPYADIYLIPSGLPHWFWSFANFDGVHYLTIAKSGYSAQFTQVFFPLYPLLVGIASSILPFINPIIIGLFISNILFLISLIMFWKLLKLDYKEKEIKWMVFFLLFFPTSFFFGSLYTESLFLLLVFASFYFVRRKRWWLSGVLGGLASATKIVGILLWPALIWEYWNQVPSPRGSPFGHPRGGFKALLEFLHFVFCILHSPILYLVPLGLLAYMIYLQLTFADPLYFWHVQPVFGAERSGQGFILLPQVFWRYGKILMTTSYAHYNFWVALWEVGSVIVSLGLLVIGWIKKIRISYLMFAFLAIILPTLTGTFSSMPRYILVAFPIFIVLGLIRNKLQKILLFFIYYLLSIIFTILFTSGRWVA